MGDYNVSTSTKHNDVDMNNFRFIGIGTVTNYNEKNNREIEVYMAHDHANLDVEIVNGKDTIKEQTNTSIQNNWSTPDGSNIKTKATKSTILTVSWLRENSNRATPPNVSLGESVSIYRVGDSDKYYWKDMFIEPTLRGQESVLFMYSNLDRVKHPNVMLDTSNSYYFYVSTQSKEVGLKTNKNDDEPLEWNLRLDTKKGCFDIFNDNGDSIHIEKDNITLSSKQVNIDAENISLNASKSLSMKSPKTDIKGGSLSISSNTSFNKATNFKAPAKLNGNAKTSDKAIVL